MMSARIARIRRACIRFACALTCALACGLTYGSAAFAADPAPKSAPLAPYDDGMPRHLQELFDPNAQVDRIVEHRSQQFSLKAERARIDMKQGPLPASFKQRPDMRPRRTAAPARSIPARSVPANPAPAKPVPAKFAPAKPAPAKAGPAGAVSASPCCTR
jgi:hypothetical protein